MVSNQVFSTMEGGGGGRLALLLSNFLKFIIFYILKLFYSLQNCVIRLKKNFFFLPTSLCEKKSF